MKLEEQEWISTEKEKVVESFWRSEKCKSFRPGQQEGEMTLSSWKRIRGPLLSNIPADTSWYQVRFLTQNHLEEIHVIGRSGWDARGKNKDLNELKKVALRKPIALTHQPREWPEVVLWGHSRKGPFTILEGNHRLVAYAGAQAAPTFSTVALIGVSPSPCCWHIHDATGLFL